MAVMKNTSDRSEPVDASSISQKAAADKPTREQLAKSGYTIPESWQSMENGEPAATVVLKPLSQVNKEADEAQRASLAAEEGHSMSAGASKVYTGYYGTQPGTTEVKAASGPPENKSAKR